MDATADGNSQRRIVTQGGALVQRKSTGVHLETDRLLLRQWKESDRAPFAAMNADPRVMEFFPSLLSREQSDRMVDRIQVHFRQHGFGLYAAELLNSQCFIGYVGLAVPSFSAAFTPCVEIGWRISAEYWGEGLATEGARAVVSYAFDMVELHELVSFTAQANLRSRRVMEKLGMTRDPGEDFDHPGVPEYHTLRRHVLYRLAKDRSLTRAAL